MAAAIVENIPEDALATTIEKVELSKMGQAPDDKAGYILNIYLKQDFVHQRIKHLNAQPNIRMEKHAEAEEQKGEGTEAGS